MRLLSGFFVTVENLPAINVIVNVPLNAGADLPNVSSSSSTLEEPVRVSEETKEYIVNRSEEIFLRLP